MIKFCGLACSLIIIACLHTWQVRIIEAALYSLYYTGTKKLMLYFPPLHDGKTAVVITPTISLMTDQVRKLSSKGLSATLLASTQKEKNVLRNISLF